jgi:hypothetical protein
MLIRIRRMNEVGDRKRGRIKGMTRSDEDVRREGLRDESLEERKVKKNNEEDNTFAVLDNDLEVGQ